MTAALPRLGMPLARVVVVWAFLTAAALCGPCRPPVATPALAAGGSP